MVGPPTAEIGYRISQRFLALAQRQRHASLFVKVGMIAGASAVIGIAQFLQPSATGELTNWQMAGVFAAFVALLGTVFLIITEHDTSRELALSQEALEAARVTSDEMDIVLDVIEESSKKKRDSLRFIHLCL